MNKGKKIANETKRFLKWVWSDDSISSYLVFLALAFILLKFLIFPVISLGLNTSYPIVAIVSGSMEHDVTGHQICGKTLNEDKSLDFNKYWHYCGDYYEKEFNISKQEFSEFPYSEGLNIGDVMILYGKEPTEIKKGDVIVFKPQNEMFYQSKGPVIHRVVKKWKEDGEYYFRTKGDHNKVSQERFEAKIPAEDIFGASVLRIPYIGMVKVVFVKIIGLFF